MPPACKGVGKIGRLPFGIVGFDPGNTFAVGVVDFSGKPLLVKSLKNAPLEEAISIVASSCVPAIFASDVYPAQDSTRKLATAFSCKTWAPEISLQVSEKRRIVQGIKLDVHERDALSAALFARADLEDLFSKAKKLAGEKWEERAYLILKGEIANLKDSAPEERQAFEIFEKKREGGGQLPDSLRIRIMRDRISSLEERLEREIGGREGLEREIEALQRERKLAGSKMPKEAVFVENKATVEKLSSEAELTRRTLSRLSGKTVVVLSSGNVSEGGAIFVRNCESIPEKEVFRRKIKIIFCEKGEPKKGFPAVVKRLATQSIFNGRFALVEKGELSFGKEEEKLWLEKYLRFISR